MENERNQIVLNKSNRHNTIYSNQRYVLMSGSVCVFIAPWYNADMTIDKQTGRLIMLCQLSDPGDEIPAFFLKDETHSWCFSIQATDENTILEVKDNVTEKLKKNFITVAGIPIDSYFAEGGADNHGFENSIISFYEKTIAKESNQNRQSAVADKDTRNKNLHIIANGLASNDHIPKESDSELYHAACFAAQKVRAKIADEKDICASLGAQAMTVPEIARISHFICRGLTLDIDWFNSDCGVIIAFLPADKESASSVEKSSPPHPVVCYYQSGSYRCYDAKTHTDQKLTAEAAANLEPKAYSIGRALPKAVITRKIITDFIKKSFHTNEIIRLLILSVLCTLIGILLPKLNQMIYDDYIPLANYSLLYQIGFVIVACMVGNVFISIVKSLFEFRIPCRVSYDLQDAIYQRIFELPESFFRSYDSAELAQRVLSVNSIAYTIISKIIVSGFTLIVSLFYWIQMFRYSSTLAGVCILMLFVLGILIYLLSRISIRYRTDMVKLDGEASGKLYQFITGIDKLRMAGAGERAILEYSTPVVREKQLSIRAGRHSALINVLVDASSTIFSMVLYYMMIHNNLNISMGAFMAFTAAFGSVTNASMGAVQTAVDYLQLKPSINRLTPILRAVPEDDTQKEVLTNLNGSIKVDHVTFGYAKDQTPVLNDLSISVSKGEYVAIVGSSGCGKSTLLKLLLGFEVPDSGHIFYDGKDLSTIDKHSLRKRLGVVLQNGQLISGSIFENITITSAQPNVARVMQTIDEVGLTEDIAAMPMGIHTVLNEAGGTISGGQKQRIIIARAIYNDPSILFFDEATSALDNITQAKVCDSLKKHNITRLVIAHRLSTVRNCDRIIVLADGRIIEEGTFDQLMARKGRFFEMASRQIV